MGLRAYSESGRRLSSAVPGEWVWTTQVAGGFAYAISARGASVIDLRSGDVVSRAATAPAGLEMLSPRTP
jgi:hypothetical protein